jgi:hypothetical protein
MKVCIKYTLTDTELSESKVSTASVLLPGGGFATKTAEISSGVCTGIVSEIIKIITVKKAKMSWAVIRWYNVDIHDNHGRFAI